MKSQRGAWINPAVLCSLSWTWYPRDTVQHLHIMNMIFTWHGATSAHLHIMNLISTWHGETFAHHELDIHVTRCNICTSWTWYSRGTVQHLHIINLIFTWHGATFAHLDIMNLIFTWHGATSAHHELDIHVTRCNICNICTGLYIDAVALSCCSPLLYSHILLFIFVILFTFLLLFCLTHSRVSCLADGTEGGFTCRRVLTDYPLVRSAMSR
jgi:hypothetical protein